MLEINKAADESCARPGRAVRANGALSHARHEPGGRIRSALDTAPGKSNPGLQPNLIAKFGEAMKPDVGSEEFRIRIGRSRAHFVPPLVTCV